MEDINELLQIIDIEDIAQMFYPLYVGNYRNQFAKIQDNEVIDLVEKDQVETEQLRNLEESDIFFMTLSKADTCLEKAKHSSHSSTIVTTAGSNVYLVK